MNSRCRALLAGAALLAAASCASPASAAASPASAASPAEAARTCSAAHLRVTPGWAMGTSAVIFQLLDFTNTGRVSCVIRGYPRVWFGRGRPVSTVGLAAADNGTWPRRTITLRPGASASALPQIADATPGCRGTYAPYFVVYPPGSRTRIVVNYGTTACIKPVRQLTVGAVQRGTKWWAAG